MNDEKKLPDETVEDVAGGTGAKDEQTKDEIWFKLNNCFAGCYFENHGGCPYGSRKNAFSKVGAGNKCPKKK